MNGFRPFDSNDIVKVKSVTDNNPSNDHSEIMNKVKFNYIFKLPLIAIAVIFMADLLSTETTGIYIIPAFAAIFIMFVSGGIVDIVKKLILKKKIKEIKVFK